MEYANLLVEEKDNILTIIINRPDKYNALSQGVMQDLKAAFAFALTQKHLCGIILTGSGDKAFVAGADISGFMDLTPEMAQQLAQQGHDIFNAIERMPIPVVAVVNGFALGGGCELSMACHMRIATPNAKFGQPEVNLGIIAGYGGTQRLVQYIGKARALELHLTADTITADTALAWGLVNYVEDDKEAALAKAVTVINKISTKGPVAIASAIEGINAYFDEGTDGFQKEIALFAALFTTEDVREGVSAFLEKRKPNFKGQ